MELKEIKERIKEARFMLGYNGGYSESDKILEKLEKDLHKELVDLGEEKKSS